MHFFAVTLSALAITGSALAQVDSRAKFNLMLSSESSTYNGSFLNACHVGAGIESLCVANTSALFYLNITQGAQSGVDGDSAPGTLQYYLNASPQGEYEGMGFYVDPSSNVALPLFGDGSVQSVAYDSNYFLNIQSNLDDSVTPPTANVSRSLSSWAVCESNFEGYVQTTLNWILGGPAVKPHNPSCESVSVKVLPVP